MVRCFSFQLFSRVVFFFFCLIFACCYHRGGSGNDRRTIKTEPRKLNKDLIDKSLSVEVFFERDERVPNLTGNVEDVTSDDTKKETYFKKMKARKETVVKSNRSKRIQNSPELPSSTSSLSKIKVSFKESSTISHSNDIKWYSNGGKDTSSFESQTFQQNDLTGTAKRKTFVSFTTKHRRSRRGVDVTYSTVCANFTFTINYGDKYSVWNNFSVKYRGRIYHYIDYRATDDGLQICGSSDTVIQKMWRNLLFVEKATMASKHCNASLEGFYPENFTLYRNLTVFFKPTEQSLTNKDYGVIFGQFVICSTKLSLSCNDYLVKVRYSEQYNIFNNFSLFYKKKMYNYREYRLTHDYLEMCTSNDSRVQAIWKTRNSRENFVDLNSYTDYKLSFYVVEKQCTAYWEDNTQYFTRNDHFVKDDTLHTCQEKFKAVTTEYTEEDPLTCNDSIIIKYSNDYKVRYDFLMLYKNKVYHYTDYRVLNDCIKICNSTNSLVRNIWRLRNYWLKATMHHKSCNQPIMMLEIFPGKYTAFKDFRVHVNCNLTVAKFDYAVLEGKFVTCREKPLAIFLKTNNKIAIAPLCALVVSIICLLLLLIVYCMLPELRTLPGLNLMSLSFAFLLWMAFFVVYYSLLLWVGKEDKIPCAKMFVTRKFVGLSILMNAAVNVYHLRKTFCGNTLVKTDENKWKRFLKYCLFGWGLPIIITIVYTVLVLTDVLRFHQVVAFCFYDHHVPHWLAVTDTFFLPVCLLLCIIVIFIFTARRIHKMLKASRSIAQKSHNVKIHKNFVLLQKLSTTPAISILPVVCENLLLSLNFVIALSLYTVALLSGVYLGIAFVFTKKNYRLLKKKYFPAKKKQVNN